MLILMHSSFNSLNLFEDDFVTCQHPTFTGHITIMAQNCLWGCHVINFYFHNSIINKVCIFFQGSITKQNFKNYGSHIHHTVHDKMKIYEDGGDLQQHEFHTGFHKNQSSTVYNADAKSGDRHKQLANVEPRKEICYTGTLKILNISFKYTDIKLSDREPQTLVLRGKVVLQLASWMLGLLHFTITYLFEKFIITLY